MPFAIEKTEKYEEQNVKNLSKPEIVGEFSVEMEKYFFPDDRRRKYLDLPTTLTNLNWDFSEDKKKIEDFNAIHNCPDLFDKRLEPLLEWILLNPHKIEKIHSGPNFVCHAGLLATITKCIYDRGDDWLIRATKFKDSIYMAAFNTEEYKTSWLNRTENEKFSIFVGNAFGNTLTVERGQHSKCTYSKYKLVLRRILGNHTLYYSAEVDGLDDAEKYVEVKTMTENAYNRPHHGKFFSTWVQCQWPGIERVFFGLKDRSNVVHTIKEHRTQDLLKRFQGNKYYAKAHKGGYQFCQSFLDRVDKTVVKDHPVIYEFYHKSKADAFSVVEKKDAGEMGMLSDTYKRTFESKLDLD